MLNAFHMFQHDIVGNCSNPLTQACTTSSVEGHRVDPSLQISGAHVELYLIVNLTNGVWIIRASRISGCIPFLIPRHVETLESAVLAENDMGTAYHQQATVILVLKSTLIIIEHIAGQEP